MSEDELISKILDDPDLLRKNGHFVLRSGLHSDTYFNKSVLSVRPHRLVQLAMMISDHFREADIDAVVGPALGAVIPSFEIARLLEFYGHSNIAHVTIEKGPRETLAVKRGLAKFLRGRRVLLVEDVITSGGTVHRAKQAVTDAGGEVVAVACLVNRGNATKADFDVEDFYAAITLSCDTWPEDECPLCRDEVPVNLELGHGRNFMLERQYI